MFKKTFVDQVDIIKYIVLRHYDQINNKLHNQTSGTARNAQNKRALRTYQINIRHELLFDGINSCSIAAVELISKDLFFLMLTFETQTRY